ncbi:MAG TPA: hypothetical protein VM910_33310 [Bradyrhizobium sp.]|nr:hypothetical protein [Bradyrhizobium sp.]
MVSPLHIATVGGHPLRFFCTPLDDGRPDLPWVAIDDLGRCLGLSRAHRRIYLAVFYRVWKEAVRTVATPDGRVSIVPHTMARASVEALIEDNGWAPASARDEYVSASAGAMMKLPRGPFHSAEALRAWVNAAMNRWSISGHTVSMAELFPFITTDRADG